tara:strand:- start:26901 stop:27437 length:537 start_codon:yes stop_codon:yes gene_type:complete
MKRSRAASRYAKAILAFAQQNNTSEALAIDLQKLNALFQENGSIQNTLENPLIPAEKKLNIVNSLFPSASESSKKLFSLLAENNRLAILEGTGKKFVELYAHSKGEIKGLISTAVPLTKDLEKTILKKVQIFSNQKINIENKIDPSIMGGFILNIGDMQFDASIANKLKEIKITLKTN